MPIDRTDVFVLKRSGTHYKAVAEDMPRLAIPATRTVMDSAAGSSGLEVDTIYWITDESRLAIATAVNAYTAMAKQGEGGGSTTINTVEVDFVAASPGRRFDVAVAGASLGQKIIASVSLDMPAGVQEDELEADPLICSAKVLSAGNVSLMVVSANGAPIIGKRNINLLRA